MEARLHQSLAKPPLREGHGPFAGLGEWLEMVTPDLEARIREHLAASGAPAVSGADFVGLVTQLFFECVREVSRGQADYRAFNAGRYLEKYADVQQAGLNPYGHYLMYGQQEGRDDA